MTKEYFKPEEDQKEPTNRIDQDTTIQELYESLSWILSEKEANEFSKLLEEARKTWEEINKSKLNELVNKAIDIVQTKKKEESIILESSELSDIQSFLDKLG